VHGLPLAGAVGTTRPEFLTAVMDWFGDAPEGLTVDLTLNQEVFHGGDQFLLRQNTQNNGPGRTAMAFILLETYGLYFFWPTWTEDVAFEIWEMPDGYNSTITVLDFVWPTGVGSGTNTGFYTAIVDGAELISNVDYVSLSWE